MKKLISLLLALVMVFSLATVAAAATQNEDGAYVDESSITLTKEYKATNTDTTSPAETFSFSSLTCTSVANAGVDPDTEKVVTAANAPVPTIGTVEYGAGDAGTEENAEKDITITLPAYTAVGVYTYTFTENAGTTAGVTYYSETITLVVTVIEQDGKIRVAAVHTEDEGEDKSDLFANEYSAGTLAVSKTVTGNLGDKLKDFTVKVTFTAPTGKTVNEAISYTDGTESKTIATTAWTNGVAEAEITLKDGETVTFTNIPYGVTYAVAENDYTGEGYDDAVYDYSDSAKKIDSAADTVGITNNKEVEVDTGISLDSAPYFLMLAVALFGMVALVSKKRYEA